MTGVPIAEAAELIEKITGRKPSPSTVKRWIRNGYKGVKLRVSGPAHFRFTTEEWVCEFLAACGPATSFDESQSERSEAAVRRSGESDRILREEFGI